MLRYRNWILGLGIMAAPGVVWGGPKDFPTAQRATSVSAEERNQRLADDVASALRSARLAGSNIDIVCGNGVCKLTGQIANAQQKAMATQLVSKVPGVTRVDNQLALMTGRAPVQQAGYNPSEKSNFVQQVGFTKPSCGTSGCADPSCSSCGTAPAMSAFSAPGAPSSGIMQASANSAPKVGNQEVAERIGVALRQANLGDQPLVIRYKNGKVVLAGSVATAEQKALAEQVAGSVYGVGQVENQIRVGSVMQASAYQQGAGGAPSAPMPMGTPPMPPTAGGYPMPGGGYPGAAPGMGMGYPGGPSGMPAAPPQYGMPGPGANPTLYNNPAMPPYAWPAQAQYPNSAAIQYPKNYSASAWPYIGPFYPYPQVPLGWRKASLEWDDGHWMLDFDSKTDRWWWFVNPKNW
ncbi:BON domain-containing protein [Thalassoroseus pseudoceratinae]|uniref:BON domain-containing protein n=1 Tax=Thalassoroseus pseudoceratinae TaxID=2713176 RepID=UPI001423686D|nr:BON domain-containing protein [Thalassoroseus pseudoceratinae]